MKYIFLFTALIFWNQTFADSGRTLWKKADIPERVKILESYKYFLVHYEKTDSLQISKLEQSSLLSWFFGTAVADEKQQCLYAGWPSFLKNGKCTSPENNNADYDKGACGANSLQCQPLLFGKKLCVPTVTLTQRRSVFSNCLKKFKESGASTAEIVKNILKNGEEKKLLMLFDLADQVCQSGPQANSGMCKLLAAQLDEVKKLTLEERTKQMVSGLNGIQQITASAGKSPSKDCPEKTKEGPLVRYETNENDSKAPFRMPPFERLMARVEAACIAARTDANGVDIQYEMDCKTNEKYAGGYAFQSEPGHPYLDGVNSLYKDGGPPYRRVEFVSRDNASNETFLYLTDVAGGPDSHDVKSVMYLLPRLGVPYTEVSGDDVIVTMTTGEKVVFDKNTHAIKSGALKEGRIDITTDRFKRQPANIQYTGKGISIRVNHRFEYPTMAGGAETAEVRQGSRVCNVPRGKIWNGQGKLLSDDDETFVAILNKHCPAKSGEVAFHL